MKSVMRHEGTVRSSVRGDAAQRQETVKLQSAQVELILMFALASGTDLLENELFKVRDPARSSAGS